MVPLDAIKAPQGKKTLELGQSWPAEGKGKEGGGSSPGAGTERPLPRPESEGKPTLAQSRRGKGTVLTWGGPSPTPREGREPADSFLGLLKGATV